MDTAATPYEAYSGAFWEETTGQNPKMEAPNAKEAKQRCNRTLDIEPVKFICRCWRCRASGVAVSDMGPLDRALARNILRMNSDQQERWLTHWAANPNHGELGKAKLLAWMAIEGGENRPEPVYFAREVLW
ncbi:hypothetical protein [Allopusillimonas ginsengisoli]|uniref:hypothetical protein n=1 Tax=Allopusillimonas ginsengisoli TaxID=453575 RepID=UPI001020FD61|nr:hypothetical protein [Allopusillimonas ginsengisoli]TEA79823.1 hypothetical protein ERE07_02470 [Allopusillimonas ginsengisoli]